MVNYGKGKIYLIEPTVPYEEGEIYYGSSTMELLSMRFADHRRGFKCYKNGKYHKILVYDLFDKYGVDNCKITLVELYPTNTKDELLAREAFYIRNHKCVNKSIPLRKDAEYYQDNSVAILKKHKDYYIQNRVVILEHQKGYRNNNVDAIKERQNAYYIKNRDKILQQKKDQRDKKRAETNN